MDVFAGKSSGTGPPAPTAKSHGVNNVTPPPGLPIDEHIFIVMILAVLFGIYIIYSYRLKAKTPI